MHTIARGTAVVNWRTLATAAAALLASAATAAGAEITLSITSDHSSVEVDVACTVTSAAGVREESHVGAPPIHLTFEADDLLCTVRSDGSVRVEARDGRGNVSQAQTSGGQVVLHLSGG